MNRPTVLGQASIPNSKRELKLYQYKDRCSIVISGGGELMSTRKHASEDALGTLPCEMLNCTQVANVLIGGLGMGFTLAAVLSAIGSKASVTVAELVPEVVEWNEGPLGAYSNYPLSDKRVTVYNGDVSDLLHDAELHFDVIALDVDNGPEALSTTGNDWLYSSSGIACACDRLNKDGVLAYWSASPDQIFKNRLQSAGLQVKEEAVFAHGKKGSRHTIWLAIKQ